MRTPNRGCEERPAARREKGGLQPPPSPNPLMGKSSEEARTVGGGGVARPPRPPCSRGRSQGKRRGRSWSEEGLCYACPATRSCQRRGGAQTEQGGGSQGPPMQGSQLSMTEGAALTPTPNAEAGARCTPLPTAESEGVDKTPTLCPQRGSQGQSGKRGGGKGTPTLRRRKSDFADERVMGGGK